MSVKLNVDGFLYHNILLKVATMVDILNVMYSDPPKKIKCCNNMIKKETRRKIQIIICMQRLTQNFRSC